MERVVLRPAGFTQHAEFKAAWEAQAKDTMYVPNACPCNDRKTPPGNLKGRGVAGSTALHETAVLYQPATPRDGAEGTAVH